MSYQIKYKTNTYICIIEWHPMTHKTKYHIIMQDQYLTSMVSVAEGYNNNNKQLCESLTLTAICMEICDSTQFQW